METTDFGKTGLKITRLGLGLAEISRQERSKVVAEADRVLNAALDGGINFLDTAACYGRTEEIIGATVAHRRDEYILATKCGHTTDDGIEVHRGRNTNRGLDRRSPRVLTAVCVGCRQITWT